MRSQLLELIALGLIVCSTTAFSPPTYRCQRKVIIPTIGFGEPAIRRRWETSSTASSVRRAPSTELRLFSRFMNPPSSKLSIAAMCGSVVMSFLLGRRSGKKSGKRQRQRLLSVKEQLQLDHLPPSNQTHPLLHLQDDLFFRPPQSGGSQVSAADAGTTTPINTPTWINFAFARVWTLFQKNTKRLVSDTIQPILDDLEHPPFVKSIRLVKFTPGKQSPLINSIRRLPSRALAEVQYAAHGIFASTSTTEFAIHCQCWNNLVNVTVPVTVSNLDIDADIWIRTRLAPYEPFVTGADVGFRSVPAVTFDLESAGIPITKVPAVRAWLVQLLTRDIPEKFVVPNVVTLDLFEENDNILRPPVAPPNRAPESMTERELRMYFPEQAALFDAMDLDNNGSLSVNEIYTGLMDWGYTAHDAVDTFRAMDRNSDDGVSLAEFCYVWPVLSASFVPDRFRGELVCFVRRAELDSSHPRWLSDPRVTVSLGEQQLYASKWDSQTSVTGGPGRPVFLQSFEFKSANAATEALDITLQERWGRRTIGTARVPLKNLLKRPNQSLIVSLDNGHRVWLELSYAEYVHDAVVPRPSPQSQELSAATVRKHRRLTTTAANLAGNQVELEKRKMHDYADELPWQ